MHPPIGLSPLAWWLVQIAVGAVLVRWGLDTIRRTSPWIVAGATALWAYATMPGFRAAVNEQAHHVLPLVWLAIRTSGTRLVDGLFHLTGLQH